jgi:hypothetical protein
VLQNIDYAITGKVVSITCAIIKPVKGMPVILDDGTIK